MVKIHRSECGCAPFDGIRSGSLYDGSKGPKAKRSQDRANDRKHQAQHCGCQ